MAYKILLFCLAVITAEALPKLGSEKCTWGPSFWCENYKQAKGCNAIEHCQQKVWSKQYESTCDTCQDVVKKLDGFLSNKTVEGEIVSFLEQICDQVAGPFAGPCKAAVDANGPKVIDSLAGLLGDAFSVCAALDLCVFKDQLSARPLPVFMPGPVMVEKKPVVTKEEKPAKSVKAGPTCALCEFVMNELDQILSDNSTEQEVIAALDQVCSLLPSTISSECEQLVKEYGPAIIQLIVEELKNPKEICTELGLCTATKTAAKEQVKSGESCELCKLAIGYLKAELSDNATEAEIKQVLEELCSHLPSSVSSECTSLVDEYLDTIVQLVLEELNADQICTELGLCTSSAKCYLGPSYWCKNKQTAIACQAVKHCAAFVWIK